MFKTNDIQKLKIRIETMREDKQNHYTQFLKDTARHAVNFNAEFAQQAAQQSIIFLHERDILTILLAMIE
jgi:hypothetical protein